MPISQHQIWNYENKLHLNSANIVYCYYKWKREFCQTTTFSTSVYVIHSQRCHLAVSVSVHVVYTLCTYRIKDLDLIFCVFIGLWSTYTNPVYSDSLYLLYSKLQFIQCLQVNHSYNCIYTTTILLRCGERLYHIYNTFLYF